MNDIYKLDHDSVNNSSIVYKVFLENTKTIIDDIENSFKKISEQSHKFIKNSIKKKLYGIKNKPI